MADTLRKRNDDRNRADEDARRAREEYLRKYAKIPAFLKGDGASIYSDPNSDAIRQVSVPNPMTRATPGGQHWLTGWLTRRFQNRW